MPTIVIAKTMPSTQVDVPAILDGKQVERSRKGALYLRPGTVEVTDDELAWLQANHKPLARHYRVVEQSAPAKQNKQLAKPTPKPVAAPEPPKDKDDDKKGGKGKSSKSDS